MDISLCLINFIHFFKRRCNTSTCNSGIGLQCYG